MSVSVEFVRKNRHIEGEKQIVPPSCHSPGLHLYRPLQPPTNQCARNHSVIVKTILDITSWIHLVTNRELIFISAMPQLTLHHVVLVFVTIKDAVNNTNASSMLGTYCVN